MELYESREVFSYSCVMHERLFQLSLQYMGYYLSYTFKDWHSVSGQHLYPVARVLQTLEARPGAEAKLRSLYPQHFTQHAGKPFMSYDLCRLLYIEKWAASQRQLVTDAHPFNQLKGSPV